ncbi:hypothetical protein TPA0907_39520 [Micromonospora humidisoli]|nr:hypothetical protein TPA0907_39520 [Micromonospora sp. AKA109]
MRGDPAGEPVGLADERPAAGGLCAELGPGHTANLSGVRPPDLSCDPAGAASGAGVDILTADVPRDPGDAGTASPFPSPKDVRR